MTVQVLLLHGLGADHRAFQRFERFLPEAWDTHAVDLLGHGDAPKPQHGYSLEDHADYIADVIAELHGLSSTGEAIAEAPVVVGHSYGAATAVVLAANYPNLARALVLLDPVLRLDHPVNAGDETATQKMIRARREHTLGEVVPVLFDGAGSALQSWIIETWQKMALGVVDELDGSWPDYAPGVECPVTVIHGDRELGGSGTSTEGLFSQGSLVRIEGAGHYLHATHAREVSAAVIEAVDAVETHA